MSTFEFLEHQPQEGQLESITILLLSHLKCWLICLACDVGTKSQLNSSGTIPIA